MYKKLLPILFLVGTSSTLLAQPTLTGTTSNPVIGDAYLINNCDTAGVLPGSSGASQVWDFTSLVVSSADTGRAVSCLSTPHCSSFSGSTLALLTPPSSNVTYLSADATKLSQVGYFQSSDTSLVLSDPLDVLQYPFTYLGSFTDTYAGIVTYSAVTAHENGTENVTADGYGILKLPGGIVDSNVLRVHTTQAFTDSAELLGAPVVEVFNFDTYTWYKAGYHTALLTITNVTLGGTPYQKLVTFAAQKLPPTAVPNVNNTAATLKLYPDPAQGQLNIDFTANNEQVRISLSDMLGREVAVIADQTMQGTQHHVYATSALAHGIYLVRIQTATETVTRKVEIQ